VIAALKPSRDSVTTTLSLLAAILLTVACGGTCGGTGSNPTTAANKSTSTPSETSHGANLTLPADLCTVVTVDAAAKALNVSATDLQSAGQQIPGACVYASKTDSKTGLFMFAQAYPDASSANAIQPDQIAAAYKSIYGISNAKVVTGVGDKAVEYTVSDSANGSTGIALFVFKANVVMFIVMTPSTDENAIQTLAKTALSQLH
jgi:hypothetical protein